MAPKKFKVNNPTPEQIDAFTQGRLFGKFLKGVQKKLGISDEEIANFKDDPDAYKEIPVERIKKRRTK
jgi:hypothetical protein